MRLAEAWKDYCLIDSGDGEKLERWGSFVLARPDPQALWPRARRAAWDAAHAHYFRSKEGGGHWRSAAELPKEWEIRYKGLAFIVRPTDFKHTGLFPEQAVNWDWLQKTLAAHTGAGRAPSLLNLFAYTGGATVAAVAAGAEVCHVDAAKGMVRWAERNLTASGLRDRPLRLISDDVPAFVQREARRGRKYDAIIIDPPTYGRGASGETWKLARDLPGLLDLCRTLLSERALFVQINGYTTGFTAQVYANLLQAFFARERGGRIESDEIGLASESGMVLPCVVFARWLAGR
jgi:23S rRNA (cytosine1962-C5)-methyltransferase